MSEKIHHTPEDLEKLLKKRSEFISIKADISRVVEPRLFQLGLENFSG